MYERYQAPVIIDNGREIIYDRGDCVVGKCAKETLKRIPGRGVRSVLRDRRKIEELGQKGLLQDVHRVEALLWDSRILPSILWRDAGGSDRTFPGGYYQAGLILGGVDEGDDCMVLVQNNGEGPYDKIEFGSIHNGVLCLRMVIHLMVSARPSAIQRTDESGWDVVDGWYDSSASAA